MQAVLSDALERLRAGPPLEPPIDPPLPLRRARVTSSTGVNVRRQPDLSSPRTGILYYRSEVDVLDTFEQGENLWLQHEAGWSAMRFGGKVYLELF